MLGKSGADSTAVYYQTPKTGPLTNKQDWGLQELIKEFNLTLDPCAPIGTKIDPSLSCCKNFYTEEDDGLVQEWKENSFINPIYTPASINPENNIELWIRRAIIMSQKYGTTNVMLLPAYTGADWWHDYILPYGVIRYIRGRVKCWQDGKPSSKTPNIDFVIVIFSSPDPKSYPWSDL